MVTLNLIFGSKSAREDISYFLCCSRKRDLICKTKEIESVCTQAVGIKAVSSLPNRETKHRV